MLSKKSIGVALALVLLLGLSPSIALAASAPGWDITGLWNGWSYQESYEFTLDVQNQNICGQFSGTMTYADLGIDATVSGTVTGDTVSFRRDDNGVTYWADLEGTVDAGAMSGTFEDINGTTGNWAASGTAVPLSAVTPIITYTGETMQSMNGVILEATIGGPSVEGYSVDFSVDHTHVGSAVTNSEGVAVLSLGSYAPGTHEVTVAVDGCLEADATISVYEARFVGGGQIVELNEDAKPYKVSFGGEAYRIGPGLYVGEWEANFHNVSDEEVIKGEFHGTTISDMQISFDPGVANFTIYGAFNGEPGYRMIVRGQDSGEPGSLDNIRMELYGPDGLVYDTDADDFPGQSDSNGTHRTYLDRGNLQIEHP